MNNFRYTVTDTFGTITRNPLGEDKFSIDWARVDETKLDYEKTAPGRMLFTQAEFQRFYSIEKSTYRCNFVPILIERNCGGVWSTVFDGLLSLNDATWNPWRCQMEVKLAKPTNCIESNFSKEINLLGLIPTKQIVNLFPPGVIIETVDYQTTTNASCTYDNYWGGSGTPAAGGWVAYYFEFQSTTHFGAPKCFKTTKWARLTLSLPVANPSPGPQWVLISTSGGVNVWATPASLVNCTETHTYDTEGHTYVKQCDIYGQTAFPSIDNGLTLKDVLERFLLVYCPALTVKSEFFQINPDVVTSTNYVTGQPTKTSNIIIFQKSDVKRPSVSGNASIANMSMEQAMNALFMFNVRWRIEGTVWRIEHISYFSKNPGFDLTVSPYAEKILGLQQYSYKTEEIPISEDFKFMEAEGPDFVGVPIFYTGGCAGGPKENKKSYDVGSVTTDLELVLNNPDPKSSKVDDKGFVFLACDGTNTVISEAPIITGALFRLNNSLAWAQLHRDYHRYYRPLSSGIMNNVLTNFLSVKPTKKGQSLRIPFCCGDVFNPDDLVTTMLGSGTVEKATFSFKDQMLTLDLLYPSDSGLYVPPVANNDVFAIAVNTTHDFAVTANDTPSPSGPITAIEIVTPPAHGVATVTGLLIHYVPTTGYTGPDNIVYRAKDGAGIPGNNALISITIS